MRSASRRASARCSDLEYLLERADQAPYAAKRRGKGSVERAAA